MLRILDENNNELSPADIDGRKGYLRLERIPSFQEEPIYVPTAFHFDDGSIYEPQGEDDSHIKTIDAAKGIYDFSFLPGETPKKVCSIDVQQQYQEIEQEREYIERYVPFTTQELKKKQAQEKEEELQRDFFANGYKRLAALEARIAALEKKA